ncbi:MAG: response regulator transcription factor, partial [Clostridia bacterium]|nr:response regulator transcription factor [Clostridia bacterium]
DSLLLDIQMKAMDGIELAEKIRETDKSVQIIFITGFSDYISKGYDVSALHYLIKPVEKEKFFEVLSKAEGNLKHNDKYLLFTVGNENIKINQSEIIFIEAFGHSSCIVSENAEYEVKYSISEIMKMLDEGFVYCHRSYIVNLKHISRITKTDVVFDNGKSVPVSRRMYSDVNKSFINFYRSTK